MARERIREKKDGEKNRSEPTRDFLHGPPDGHRCRETGRDDPHAFVAAARVAQRSAVQGQSDDGEGHAVDPSHLRLDGEGHAP